MSYTTDFSGRDIVKALTRNNFQLVGRSGSHVKLRYTTDDGTVRNVTVPMQDRIPKPTLRSIADQCGANSFAHWCMWIAANR